MIFEQADGTREVHDAAAGDTVMDCALDHAVQGLRGQCGGGCTCGTCHCWVDPAWRDRIPPATGDEAELLEWIEERADGSRLACRIVLNDALDGIVVRIPPATRVSG